jgi:DNA repair protein RadC
LRHRFVAGIILKQSAVTVTQNIKKAAAPLGVVLHDHVIIGRNSHTSCATSS